MHPHWKNRSLRVVTTAVAVAGVLSGLACDEARPGRPAPASLPSSPCSPHRLPEAECPFCHPKLIDEMGECRGHGVPEALCWKCNPSLIPAFKAMGDWCSEHAAPESLCPICSPSKSAAEQTAATDGSPPERRVEGIEVLAPSDVPRSRRPPSVTCTKENLRIRLNTPDMADRIGLETVLVERRAITETLTCNAEVRYDGRRYLRLIPRAPGVVREVLRDVGESVQAGDAVLVVDSVALATAKSEYLQAQASVALWKRNFEREQQLVDRGVSPGREALEAETKLAEARITLAKTTQALRNLGLSEAEIESVASANDTSPTLAVRAPFQGLVVERSVVAGDVADGTRPLAAIADISSMWATLDVHAADLPRVQVGHDVVLSIDGLPGYSFPGTIAWISSEVDPRTRTVPVRAELSNSDGMLRANMFGRAIIRLHQSEPVVVVPRSAVQWEGCCNVVFVRQSQDTFLPRKVTLGCETGDFVEVASGVTPGEQVVTQGSFLLKTEILKGSIGAGCCEVDHLSK